MKKNEKPHRCRGADVLNLLSQVGARLTAFDVLSKEAYQRTVRDKAPIVLVLAQNAFGCVTNTAGYNLSISY